jgi:hypothetical protein
VLKEVQRGPKRFKEVSQEKLTGWYGDAEAGANTHAGVS